MYEKIRKIGNYIWDNYCTKNYFKCVLILSIALIFCVCVVITYNNGWSYFSYPEKQYSLLEEEANRLTLNHNFDTSYRYTITTYDSETKRLEFDLYSKNTSITITVDNYNTKDEFVDITRPQSNAFLYSLTNIFLLIIILPIYVIGLLSTLIFIAYSLFWLIAYILHIIIQHFKNKT